MMRRALSFIHRSSFRIQHFFLSCPSLLINLPFTRRAALTSEHPLAHARGTVVFLERNLVVLDVRLGRTPAAAARRALCGGRGLLGLSDGDAFHVPGAVEELHVRGVDFQRVALL